MRYIVETAHLLMKWLGAAWRGELWYPQCAIWQKQKVFRIPNSSRLRRGSYRILLANGGMASRLDTLMVECYSHYVLCWIANLLILSEVSIIPDIQHLAVVNKVAYNDPIESSVFYGLVNSPRQSVKGNAPVETGASYPNADVQRRGLSEDYSHILGYLIANPQPL
jgi:hypothetical protein